MQSMLGTKNSIILSLAYYNNILSLQNLFQLSPMNFIIIWLKLTQFISRFGCTVHRCNETLLQNT